jgi:hypothetical protein
MFLAPQGAPELNLPVPHASGIWAFSGEVAEWLKAAVC